MARNSLTISGKRNGDLSPWIKTIANEGNMIVTAALFTQNTVQASFLDASGASAKNVP